MHFGSNAREDRAMNKKKAGNGEVLGVESRRRQ